jgi:hypothetical protein
LLQQNNTLQVILHACGACKPLQLKPAQLQFAASPKVVVSTMLVAELHLPIGWRCMRTDKWPVFYMLLQASAGGDSVVPLYWNLGQARDVFWARYVDWFLTVSATWT